MEMLDAIKERHSVRTYLDKPIEGETLTKLQSKIKELNDISGLNMQLILNEPKAFDSFLAHYGKFKGVNNYIAIVGNKDSSLAEKAGYFGEQLVLYAQTLGLNTCWVALTFKKIKDTYVVKKNEKMQLVIAIGYGEIAGHPHKSKTFEEVTKVDGEAPDWFVSGVMAALLAPTAVNQQAFTFIYKDGVTKLKRSLRPYADIDAGIVKYHFELASGKRFNNDNEIHE